MKVNLINSTIEVGDVVQEKEGNRRNGLVLKLTIKYFMRGTKQWSVPYQSARILWPDGKQNSYKLSFLEKMF